MSNGAGSICVMNGMLSEEILIKNVYYDNHF